jgi:O-acetyl-ADP-ribose deacetylase
MHSTEYKGCNYCKHFQFDGSCPAFSPDPIPLDIVSGQTKHFRPVSEQHNSIVYEHSDKSIFQRRLEQEEKSEVRG